MKKNKIIYWIATSIIFLFEGVMPFSSLLLAPRLATAGTEALGYPDYFAISLIICKALGVAALVVPGLHPTIREWAYAGLTCNLVFAFISHAVVDQSVGYMFMPLVMGAILAISYIYYHKTKTNG